MRVLKMEVNKTEKVSGKNQYVKVGEVEIYYPSLEECSGFVQSAKVLKEGDDGVPEYESPEANFIQSAILAYIKSMARNKLQPGSISLKDGLSIATDWAGLTAEGTRSGEALAIIRECKADFVEWISKQGKSEKATAVYIQLFSNRQALQLQGEANKAKMASIIEAFAEALPEDKAVRYQRPLENLIEACSFVADDLE